MYRRAIALSHEIGGGSGGVSKMLKFLHKGFYVMSWALTGKLSCIFSLWGQPLTCFASLDDKSPFQLGSTLRVDPRWKGLCHAGKQKRVSKSFSPL